MAYLVGRGLSDITGEPADCGMLGYGKSTQRTKGLHTRLRARAFVFADADDPQRRLLLVRGLQLPAGLLLTAVACHREPSPSRMPG